MKISGLLDSQVAEIGRLIVAADLNIAEFGSDVIDTYRKYERLPVIRHEPTGFWFGFGRYYTQRGYSSPLVDVGFLAVAHPGLDQSIEPYGPRKWSEVRIHFVDWLGFIKREVEATDVWSTLIRTHDAKANSSSENDKKMFSELEKEAILHRLSDVENELAAVVQQNSVFATLVRNEFAELRAELDMMSRGRWKKMFLGTLASMAVKQAVPEDAIRNALESSRDLLFDLARSLPPGS